MSGDRAQSSKISRRGLVLAALIAPAALARAYSLGDQKVRFNVPVQAMDTALVAYAEQAHVQLVVSNDILKGLRTSGVAGEFDPKSALELLLRDTGLEFQITGPDTVTVRTKSASQ